VENGRRKKVFSGYRGFPIRLQNFVATIDLRCALDLQTIQHKVRNAEYNPQKFAACVIRIRKPRCTALVFESGKMVVTGAGCHEDSKLAATKFASTVSRPFFIVATGKEEFVGVLWRGGDRELTLTFVCVFLFCLTD
jgi:TATA-box binding protein (TBP) (component of TFIID and TFIIIB)